MNLVPNQVKQFLQRADVPVGGQSIPADSRCSNRGAILVWGAVAAATCFSRLAKSVVPKTPVDPPRAPRRPELCGAWR
jgi:hypothetical protein